MISKPWTDDERIPRRLTMKIPEITIIHFSGEMKLWDRDHLGTEGTAEYDEKFAEQVLCSNQPWNTKLWIQRNGTEDEYATFGIRLTATGWEPKEAGVSSAAEVSTLIARACDQARKAACLAVVRWRTDLEGL